MYDVLPQTAEDVDSARDNAIVLNKQFEKDIDRTSFIDEYVRTAVDEGTVIVRVGWEYEEEEVTYQRPVTKMVYPPEVEQQLMQAQQAVQMGQMDPIQFQQMMIAAEQQKYEIETDEFDEVTEVRTVVNRPTLEVCDYTKVMIDPTCYGDLDKALFIVYQFYASKAQLRESGLYQNIDAIIDDGEDTALDYSDEDIIHGTFKFKD
jgi:hypothetical protein